jgi:Trk-type K+ transport system membrane component
MASTSHMAPAGLPKLGIAVLTTFLMLLGAVLMHTLMGHTSHDEAMPGMSSSASTTMTTTTVHAAHHPGENGAHALHASESVMATTTATLSDAVPDCGGLCAMICSLMGMACLMVVIVFAISWLRGRTSRALFVGSRAIAAAPRWAHSTIPRPEVSLTALSILRV